MTRLQIVLSLLGLVKQALAYLASLQGADALRAKIALDALNATNQRIDHAMAARDDALAQLDASGVSDHTHFRD